MNQFQYTTLDRVLAKLGRSSFKDIDESEVIEWCGEALEAIGTPAILEEAVAFIEVSNHQCFLPPRFKSIIQVAKYGGYTKEVTPACILEVAKSSDCAIHPDAPKLVPITIDGALFPGKPAGIDYLVVDNQGMPVMPYEIAYYRPYFDIQYEYKWWKSSGYYKNGWYPIRPSSHSFFNAVLEDEQDIYRSCNDEYKVIQGKILRFSFKEGMVAVAYNRHVLDAETGYPMIPDTYSCVTAITKYVIYQLMEREFYAGREGAQSRYQKAESDWQWYCGQAANQFMMPYGEDEYQNLLNQRGYLIPDNNKHGSFFGTLGEPQKRGRLFG